MIRAATLCALLAAPAAAEDWPELFRLVDACEAGVAANSADPLRALGVVIGPETADEQFGLVTVDGAEVTVLFLVDEVTPVCTILGLNSDFDISVPWEAAAAKAWEWSGGAEPEFDGSLSVQNCAAEPRPWSATIGPERGAYFPVPEGEPAPFLYEIEGLDPEECPESPDEGET